jgi:cephalosporin hydroxylase
MPTADHLPPEVEARLQELEIFRSYKRSKYLSIKHSSYFHVYEELLAKYRGRTFTFIEIGVLNGGSLFMWRDYFGPAARIIGIDINPDAKKWEKDGFEIFLGSQSDEKFWDELFSAIGDVDVVLDDGGHTNDQQIVTTEKCIPHIKDGGLLIVEDTHASYLTSFGNPSKYSFINYCKTLIDSINSRFPSVKISNNSLNRAVRSIEVYESIVCFRVDRAKCFESSLMVNEGLSSNARDYRDHGSKLHASIDFLSRKLPFLENAGAVSRIAADIARLMFSVRSKLRSRKLAKYFR